MLKPLTDFQILEKDLVERRFGVIALMCKKILNLQRMHKNKLSVTLGGEKNGKISFDVYDLDTELTINKDTLTLQSMRREKAV